MAHSFPPTHSFSLGKPDPEVESESEMKFFLGLLELQYGQPVAEKLSVLARDVPWAKGWPEDNTAFWNAEAFLWERKISPEIRGIIVQELAFLAPGRNLDLGCGAYSYVSGSVGVDISDLMLRRNDRCKEKIIHDLELPLPFSAHSFDSVTAVFLLNYLVHPEMLLQEVRRVLKPEGKCEVVLSARPVNAWQRQKELHSLRQEQWEELFRREGFQVSSFLISGLWFFQAKPS